MSITSDFGTCANHDVPLVRRYSPRLDGVILVCLVCESECQHSWEFNPYANPCTRCGKWHPLS